jgi:hypothetical protein
MATIPEQGVGQVCDRGLPQRVVKRLPRRFAPRNNGFDALYTNKCCAREGECQGLMSGLFFHPAQKGTRPTSPLSKPTRGFRPTAGFLPAQE